MTYGEAEFKGMEPQLGQLPEELFGIRPALDSLLNWQ